MQNRLFLLTVLSMFFAHVGLTQSEAELDKGDKAFDNFDFQEAMFFYQVALDANQEDPAITRRIANTYRRMGQLANSAEFYQKTILLDSSQPEDMLFYAEALKNLQEYEQAIHWYEMYNKQRPTDSRAKSHLSDRFYYRDLFADTARYDMKSLKINNENPVIGISLFEDEKILVSAVQLEKGKQAEASPFLDIYVCDFNSSKELEHPVQLDKKVNSKYHDGPAFYSFSEHKLYITRNNIRNGKPVRDKNGNVNLKIYSSEYQNGEWTPAQELRFNDDGYSTGHPCLSKDGQTMYIVSTRPGGIGGSDLYQCLRVGNNWTEPINLGPNVNSEGNEMFPFVGEDGYLCFTSDGHAGLGGLDIFRSMNKNEVWQAPTNLGAPINSQMDDFALVYDKESDNGYFCSNRSGNGDDNLYFYKHILIDKMIVAGTIKATAPNISLAGERILIKKLNTGITTTQRLDEFERFEFEANAGEKVEITFVNAEYFDENKTVVTYSVPELIEDPFVNIGTNAAELKKIPSYTGKLNSTPEVSLAETKSNIISSGNTVNGSENENSKELNDLNDARSNANVSVVDDSTLLTKKKQEEELNQNLSKIKEADQLFAQNKLIEARGMYLSASAVNTSEKYPKEMISKIDELSKAAEAKSKKDEYNSVIQTADQHYASERFADALKNYEIASSMFPGENYPKEQIEKIKSAIANAQAEQALTKNEVAVKKISEFEKAVPVIDLVGMSIDNVTFDYNKSFIRDEDKATLDKLCTVMKENPSTTLFIRAHCDSRGSLAYNQSLSMSRAMAVQGYLMQKGIRRDRIYSEWYGEQRPLNGCLDNVPCEEQQYEVNRRAEFKLVAKK
jgi:outer membrane protein OmpA-like peptidoglycan-associated protein